MNGCARGLEWEFVDSSTVSMSTFPLWLAGRAQDAFC